MSAEDSHTRELRYARQRTLSDWGDAGQARLDTSRVLVVGLGGLGAPVVSYLAGAGVGALTLNDFDEVDLSNLARQPLYATADVGAPKTAAAGRFVAALNPNVKTKLVPERLLGAALTEAVNDHDVVVDCSDNFSTRFAVNAASVATDTPLVSAAAIRYEGQIAVFDPGNDGPCYACLYGADDEGNEDCQGQGVMGPVVGVMGSLAAVETLKVLLGLATQNGQTSLLCYSAIENEWRKLTLRKDPDCPVCQSIAA